MKILGRLAVFPTIPEPIARLHELAYNLWWTWNPDAVALYASLDPALWDRVEHSAVRLLSEVKGETLERRATDRDFLKRYDAVLAAFDAYMRSEDTWFSQTHPDATHKTIAYFSRRVRPPRVAAHLLRWPGRPRRRPLQRGQRPRPALRRRWLSLSPGLLPPAHHPRRRAGSHLRQAQLLAGPRHSRARS